VVENHSADMHRQRRNEKPADDAVSPMEAVRQIDVRLHELRQVDEAERVLPNLPANTLWENVVLIVPAS